MKKYIREFIESHGFKSDDVPYVDDWQHQRTLGLDRVIGASLRDAEHLGRLAVIGESTGCTDDDEHLDLTIWKYASCKKDAKYVEQPQGLIESYPVKRLCDRCNKPCYDFHLSDNQRICIVCLAIRLRKLEKKTKNEKI